jgi:DNA (cytosine-5)-methyltransferase 1
MANNTQHIKDNDVDTTKTTTHVSLCAGYGGIDLGLKRAIPNLRTIAFSEIEAFACANLVAKMEEGLLDTAPIWTDLKTFPWAEFRDRVDLLSGGYPCQPFSAAGKRLGKDDPRHLWPWIAEGIRTMRPRICFFENVEGHISMGLSSVISDLEELGYRATWGIFSAAEVGAPHQRKRVFIMAHCASQRGEGEALSRWISQGHANLADHRSDEAWPSRPGEPQHAWEPPRVVLANAADNGCAAREAIGRVCGEQPDARRQEESEGVEQFAGSGTFAGLCAEAMANDHSTHAGHGEQRTERTRGDLSGGCGEAMGISEDRDSRRHALQLRQGQAQHRGASGSVDQGGRQTQPPLGGDADGAADWMDYAELFTTADNRTDELRLLGNGVVPTTAERAFVTLMQELCITTQ